MSKGDGKPQRKQPDRPGAPGALGTRDGAWLLPVERRPHDTVLDRFPRSWGWVKRPWMPEPLRVEW